MFKKLITWFSTSSFSKGGTEWTPGAKIGITLAIVLAALLILAT